MSRNKMIECLLICLLIVTAIAALALGLRVSRGARAFRRYVCRPIPASVDDIRADLGPSRSGRKHVLRFKIGATDIAVILQSRAFERFASVSFNGSSLTWEDPQAPADRTSWSGNSEDMALYWTKKPPEWFKPGDWDRPKVYRFREKWGNSSRSHVQVLIHDESSSEAYFIDYVEGR